MKTLIKWQLGFTLIELLIVVFIISILAALAVPAYLSYVSKSYFSEVISATASYKLAVEACYQIQGAGAAVTGCAGGSNGVPANNTTGEGNVGSITVSSAGVITATGSTLHNLSSYTYILTPTPTNNVLIWTVSGTCQAAGLC